MTESEREEYFARAQADLIERFKVKLKSAADDVLSSMYTDVVNYAATDAHTNYHNFLRDEMRQSLIQEISSEYGHYSWAHGIRMELLNKHPEVLRNKIISDLQEQVKSLKEHVMQLQERRY
jgi:hypothetical protein